MLNETRALVEVLQVIYLYYIDIFNINYYYMLLLYYYYVICILLQDMIGDDRNDINNSLEDSAL